MGIAAFGALFVILTLLRSAIGPHRGLAAEALPAGERDVDVHRVELDRGARPVGPLAGDEGAARPGERIEDEVVGAAAVTDCAFH